jgi:hypothetical protein
MSDPKDVRAVYVLVPSPPGLALPTSIYLETPGLMAAGKYLVGIADDTIQIHGICNNVCTVSTSLEPALATPDEHGNYFVGIYPCRQLVRKFGEYDKGDEFPAFLRASEYITPTQEMVLRAVHAQWPFKNPLGPRDPIAFQEWTKQIRALGLVRIDAEMATVLVGLYLRG